MQNQIDYAPLEKMHHSGLTVMRKSFKGFGWPVFLGVTVLSFFAALKLQSGAFIFIIIVYAGVMGAKINSYKNKIWQEFDSQRLDCI